MRRAPNTQGVGDFAILIVAEISMPAGPKITRWPKRIQQIGIRVSVMVKPPAFAIFFLF
jgi:hypothetical protein